MPPEVSLFSELKESLLENLLLIWKTVTGAMFDLSDSSGKKEQIHVVVYLNPEAALRYYPKNREKRSIKIAITILSSIYTSFPPLNFQRDIPCLDICCQLHMGPGKKKVSFILPFERAHPIRHLVRC